MRLYVLADVETKLPEGLKLKFVHCRPDERYSTLISLLKYVVPDTAQTVVFAGTQHHVELISYVSVVALCLVSVASSNVCVIDLF